MPTKAQLEDKYDCPAYGAWTRVPKNLKPRKWFAERGVKIPKHAKPDGVKGQYGSFVKFFLYDLNYYDLEFFIVYEIWAYRSRTDVAHLYSGKDRKAAQSAIDSIRRHDIKNEFLLYGITEEKIYPVKK